MKYQLIALPIRFVLYESITWIFVFFSYLFFMARIWDTEADMLHHFISNVKCQESPNCGVQRSAWPCAVCALCVGTEDLHSPSSVCAQTKKGRREETIINIETNLRLRDRVTVVRNRLATWIHKERRNTTDYHLFIRESITYLTCRDNDEYFNASTPGTICHDSRFLSSF